MFVSSQKKNQNVPIWHSHFHETSWKCLHTLHITILHITNDRWTFSSNLEAFWIILHTYWWCYYIMAVHYQYIICLAVKVRGLSRTRVSHYTAAMPDNSNVLLGTWWWQLNAATAVVTIPQMGHKPSQLFSSLIWECNPSRVIQSEDVHTSALCSA